MIVAKFGGTSVADSSCISRVLDIIKNNPEQQVVVVSALGGITNMIQESAQCAANGDLKYQEILSEIEERHFACIKELIPIKDTKSSLESYQTTNQRIEYPTRRGLSPARIIAKNQRSYAWLWRTPFLLHYRQSSNCTKFRCWL